MNTDFLNIAGIFRINTDLFKKTIQGIPSARLLARPADDSNHLLWIAGHVVVHRARVLKLLAELSQLGVFPGEMRRAQRDNS